MEFANFHENFLLIRMKETEENPWSHLQETFQAEKTRKVLEEEGKVEEVIVELTPSSIIGKKYRRYISKYMLISVYRKYSTES